jgi:hypothetical protein
MSRRTVYNSFLYIVVTMIAMAFVTNSMFAEPLKEVTLIGENYCVGCSLKKAEGAAAQCSIYGHKHALKVEKAVDSKGKEVSELKGATLHYLENDSSVELFKGEEYHGKNVIVKGNVHLEERVVDVKGVE